MADGHDEGPSLQPALQVIVLGSGGGPVESNVTAMLVHSVTAGWTKGSVVAVDAGVHLSAITRILQETSPEGLGTHVPLPHTLESGPFAGMQVNFASPVANASHITRTLLDTYLITHPHLDHISGFVINTAGLPGARPKRLAGLQSTISAFKNHIFNNVIWPNLSDENNGAGLVTFMRLVEGGSPALGEGDGKGYTELSDGIGVRIFSVSHGHCIEKHTHRGSSTSSRFGSMDGSSTVTRGFPGSGAAAGPGSLFRTSSMPLGHGSPGQERESVCVYDSSAYFIRDTATGREVLIFGDVEPDSLSLSPRNLGIWQEAAPRIAKGNLKAIFIECSYDDSQTEDRLFGHLTPRFVIEEMSALASEVENARQFSLRIDTKKRKRGPDDAIRRSDRVAARSSGEEPPVSPKSTRPSRSEASGVGVPADLGFDTPPLSTPTKERSLSDLEHERTHRVPEQRVPLALKGLKVVIIHVKERLTDGKPIGETIIEELQAHEEEAQLGCEFLLSHPGESFML